MRPILILAVASACLGASLLDAGHARAFQTTFDPALAAASDADREALERLEAEALALTEAGRFAEADAVLATLLDVELRVYGPDHAIVANTHGFRATVAEMAGDLSAGAAHRRVDVAVRERLDDEAALADARRSLGANLVSQGIHEEALPLLGAAYDAYARLLAPDDDRRLGTAFNLGRAHYAQGRAEEAAAVLVPAYAAISGPEHDGGDWTGFLANDLGVVLHDLERHAEAEAPMRRACELFRASASARPGWASGACLTLADILIALERGAEADPLLASVVDDADLDARRRSDAVESLIALRTAGSGAVDEALLQTAIHLRGEVWGEDQASYAFAINRLGLWLRNQEGRDEEALGQFVRAHDIYVAGQGITDQSSMSTAASITRTLNALGRRDEALAFTADVLARIEPAALSDQRERRAYRVLALTQVEVLRDAGHIDDARALLAERLEMLVIDGASPRELADTHGVMADMASRQRDWPAMAEHRRAVMDHLSRTDDAHALARATANYGQVLSQIGEMHGAYDHLSRAIAALEAIGHEAREDRLYAMTYLGFAAGELGRLDEAEVLLEAVLEARRAAPDRAGRLGIVLGYLAGLRVNQDRLPEAETLYLEARTLAEANDDAEAASFVDGDLGELWRFMGRHDEAEAALRRVLDYTARRYGADSVQNATPLRNLAAHLTATGRKERALDVLLQAMALEQRAGAPDEAGALRTRVQIGRILGDLGRYAEAEAMFDTVLGGAEGRLAADHVVMLEAATQRGFMLARLGRYADSAEQLEDVATLTENAFGADSRQMINVLQLLSYALYMDHRYEETIAIMNRADRLVDAEGARWPATVVDVKSNLGRTYIAAGRPGEALAPLRQAARLAAHLSREQAVAAGARADISREPFRALVQAAWTVGFSSQGGL